MNLSSEKGGPVRMTDAKKFLFDTNDFSQVKSGAGANTYTEEQLLLARSQGKAEGLAEAKQQQEERIAELLRKISGVVEKLDQAEKRRDMEKFMETIKLTMRVMHKILPRFSSQYALHEIEHVILREINDRKEEPRIAVTVPTAHLEALKARIDAVALEKGFAGKVILLADDGLPPTDCRVEWADGGAERIYERLSSQIENEFAKAISGVKAGLEQAGKSQT